MAACRATYAVGSGHTYNVLPRGGEAGAALLDDCRKVLEDFRQRNKWSKRQKETVRRLDRDGERFLRLFVDEARGELNVRFVEPLEIQNPPDKTSADGVYFGIQSLCLDHRYQRRHAVRVPQRDGPGRQERGRHSGRVAGRCGGLGDARVHAFRRCLEREFFEHDGG